MHPNVEAGSSQLHSKAASVFVWSCEGDPLHDKLNHLNYNGHMSFFNNIIHFCRAGQFNKDQMIEFRMKE